MHAIDPHVSTLPWQLLFTPWRRKQRHPGPYAWVSMILCLIDSCFGATVQALRLLGLTVMVLAMMCG